jgi:hypothetical protein
VVFPPPGWQRVALGAILVLPLLVLVLLSAPAWLTWPFLSADRRKTVLQFVDRIADWARSLTNTKHG